jgi:hypothetical protein
MVYDGADQRFWSERWPIWAIVVYVILVATMIFTLFYAMRGEAALGIAPSPLYSIGILCWLAGGIFWFILRRRTRVPP